MMFSLLSARKMSLPGQGRGQSHLLLQGTRVQSQFYVTAFKNLSCHVARHKDLTEPREQPLASFPLISILTALHFICVWH